MIDLLFSGLVHILPYALLELFAFRYRLRYPPAVVVPSLVLLCALELALGIWTWRCGYREIACMLASALYLIFFVLMINDHTGKVLFAVLMVANHSNLTCAVSQWLELWLLPGTLGYAWQRSVLMLGVEALFLLPMFWYVRKVYARILDPGQQVQAWQYLWLIPLIFLMIRFSVLEMWFTQSSQLSGALKNMLFSALLSLGNVFVYMMVYQLIQDHKTAQQLQEAEYMLTMQRAQYDHLKDRIEETRRARHDLRHHLHLVSAYLSDGKLDELRQYLDGYSQTIPDENRMIYCGNYAANALLNYFDYQAQSEHIDFQAAVHLPESVGIPNDALTVVLGNLLENAIHGCQAEPEYGRSIQVRGRCDASAVFFQVSNTCTQPLRIDKEGKVLSTKPGGQGIGLTSVAHIAKQYDGMMEVEQKNDRFIASIMLTIPDEM